MVPDFPTQWDLKKFDLHIDAWKKQCDVDDSVVDRVRSWKETLREDPIGNASPELGNEEIEPWMNVYSSVITDAENYGPIFCMWQVVLSTHTVVCLEIRNGF